MLFSNLGNAAIHYASMNGYETTVAALIRFGGNVSLKNLAGKVRKKRQTQTLTQNKHKQSKNWS